MLCENQANYMIYQLYLVCEQNIELRGIRFSSIALLTALLGGGIFYKCRNISCVENQILQTTL
jgi:hypothetical protein